MNGGRPLAHLLAGAMLAIAVAPALAADEPEPKYEALVQRLKSGDLDVDFEALRMAYTRSDYFSSDDADVTELRGAMFDALAAGDMAKAGDRAQRILDRDYVDIDAHLVAGIVHRRGNDDDEAEFHRTVGMALLQSIQDSGDGRSKESAFVVISTDEELALLRSQGLQIKSRSMTRGGGHAFDIVEVTDDAGHAGKLYFNLDIPLGLAGPNANKPEKN